MYSTNISKLNTVKFYFYTYLLVCFVILWGALVRVTHSGAGCGSHWPLCNGEVIPLAPSIELIIEFTHRLTSGLSALVVFFIFFAYRKSNHANLTKAIRFAAFFMLVEVCIGASIVLFGWVKDNTSITRAIVVSLHLVNSFLLLASLNIAVNYKTLITKPKRLKLGEFFLVILFLIVSSFGAVTALGDTLFPSVSLAEGISKDFASNAHILLSLRVYHPILAVILSFFLIRYAISRDEVIEVKSLSTFLIISVVFQICLGILTILLLAPAYMQIVHLLGSIVVWHFLVRLVTFPSYSASE